MSMSNYLVASLVASLLTSCSLLPSSLKRTIALIQYDLLGGNLNFATWIEIDWHSELGCQSASVSHCIVNKSWFEWGGTSVHLLLLICYTIQSSHLLRQKERKEKKKQQQPCSCKLLDFTCLRKAGTFAAWGLTAQTSEAWPSDDTACELWLCLLTCRMETSGVIDQLELLREVNWGVPTCEGGGVSINAVKVAVREIATGTASPLGL